MARLNVIRARVIARTERRVWESDFVTLSSFLEQITDEGPTPVFDEMTGLHTKWEGPHLKAHRPTYKGSHG